MKDANDMFKAGVDLGEMLDNARPYKSQAIALIETKVPSNVPEAERPYKLTCFADVETVAIDWLWKDYLARGKLTLLGGDPDLGKSQISIDAAARLSKGIHWPFGALAPTGSTIFLCSEDGLADTIKPRAEAAGADVSKLHALSSTVIKSGKLTPFTLKDDLDMLGAAVKQVSASLVCIDAITSYMGKLDNNSTPDVRAVLDPVSQWAEEMKVSVLGVTHPPKAAQKNAIRQFTGSFAYIAAARIAFFVTKEPETDRILLLAVKNNIGPKALGRAYRIATREVGRLITAPYIQWDDGPVDFTADQAIAANAAAARGDKVETAKEFLQELLADGPFGAVEGLEAAKDQGISERTLARARKELGVKAEHDASLKGGWKWTLER